MIVTKHKQLFHKQKGSGLGSVVIYGKGIFTDTMKMLGKKMWVFGKTMFKNRILPNLKAAAKHGLKTGKQIIEDNKKEIEKAISDKSKALIKNLLDRIPNVKETNKNEEDINQHSQEKLDKLLYGEGLKIIRNRKK